MIQVKFVLYGITVVCYLAAGILDMVQKNPNPGILAISFGILNIVIFFWRTGD